MKEVIVISGVNLVDGGPFSVLIDCLEGIASSDIIENYDIIVLVNSVNRMPTLQGVKFIEYPKAKQHYIYRLYYEYIYFRKLSKKLKPKLWLSLHDMSPRVEVEIQAVYMHNTIPFHKPKLIDWRFIPINAVWAYLYKYLYKINIHSNKYLVVQQDWLRNEFSKMFSFPQNRIIVARPLNKNEEGKISSVAESSVKTFIYPAFPRVFKNYEVICEAAKVLKEEGVDNIKIKLTIDGTENKYSKFLVEKYSSIETIEFMGLIPRSEMSSLYSKASCLLFPSKLESWGLPLSEFKPYNKPMIVADLPYAHESAAGASLVRFFNPNDAVDLADGMKTVAQDDFSSFHQIPDFIVKEPCSNSWKEMFDILLGNNLLRT